MMCSKLAGLVVPTVGAVMCGFDGINTIAICSILTPVRFAIAHADYSTFADDSMAGREAGTEGNLRGAAFIAREARRLGLQPAGEGGTYYQDIPFVRRTAAAGGRLVVDGVAVDTGDYVVALSRGTPRALDGTAQAVYGGTAAEPGLTREQAADFTSEMWDRLGMDPHDKTTWTQERIHMPVTKRVRVSEFAPRVRPPAHPRARSS